MERYVAVVGKSKDMFVLIELNSDTLRMVNKVIVNKSDIPRLVVGCRPLNFGIVDGKFVESQGDLNRLNQRNGVQPHIVVEELATSVGTIVGYRLLNPISNTIVAMKKEDILKRQSQTDVPLLQNGIIRGNKINCYKGAKFPRFVIGTKTRSAVKKPKISNNESTSKLDKPKKDFIDNFTSEQRRELAKARHNGVDIRFISNPELSPEQMRVLWVSKKNGSYSEYFAKPEYSTDVMKFYADRLVTQNMVKECSDMLARPTYGIDKLTEIYLAVCEGIDYTSFIDLDSAGAMQVQREKLRAELWDSEHSTGTVDASFINSGVKLADKLKRS